MALSTMSSFDLPQRRKVVTYGKKATASKPYRFHNNEEEEEKRTTDKSTSTSRLASSSTSEWKPPPPRQPISSNKAAAAPQANGRDVFDFPFSEDELSYPKAAGGLSNQGLPKKTLVRKSASKTKENKPTADIYDFPDGEDAQSIARSNPTSRPPSPKRKTPAPIARRLKTAPAPLHTSTADVFDVPSSDNEGPLPSAKSGRFNLKNLPSATEKATHKASKVVRRNQTEKAPRGDAKCSQSGPAAEPSRKRRRVTPAPSIDSAPDDESIKSAGTTSRGSSLDLGASQLSPSSRSAGQTKPLKKKQQPQTRQKAEISNDVRRKAPLPLTTRPALLKGKSSPAALRAAIDSSPKPSSALSGMMDIDDVDSPQPGPITPRPRNTTHTVPTLAKSISATPTQKALWSNLLDDSETVSTVKKLNFSALRIAKQSPGKAPSSRDANLQKKPARRRLIDSLKQGPDEPSDDSSSGMDLDENGLAETAEGTSSPNPRRINRLEDEPRPSQDAPLPLSTESQGATMSGLGTRVTYAKQRSYLQDTMVDDVLSLNLLEDDMPSRYLGAKRGGPSSQQRDPFDVDDDDSEDGTGGMRNIHELRAAGQNKRIKNEMDTLLEDLEQSDLSRSSKRSAMLELALKLTEREFRSYFMDMGFTSRLIRNCSKGCADDVILGYSFAAAVGFVIKDGVPQIIFDDISQSGAISNMLHLLVYGGNIDRLARDRGTNMSKMAISTMASLHRAVKQSSLWEQDPPEYASPRLLVMKNLEILLAGIRAGGKEGRLLSQEVLVQVLDIGKSCVAGATTSSETTMDLRCLQLALSITKFASQGSVMGKVLSGQVLGRLLEIIQPVFSALELPDGIHTPALQICLALTNGDSKAIKTLATSELVLPLTNLVKDRFNLVLGSISAEQWDATLNILNFALGTMINLCEKSEEARLAIIYDSDDPLIGLVEIFLRSHQNLSQADSVAESQINIANGHLSVLLGTLCLDSTVRQKIRARLPSGNLGVLIGTVEEFTLHNQKVEELMASQAAAVEEEEGNELRSSYKGYTAHLRLVGSRLKEFEVRDM